PAQRGPFSPVASSPISSPAPPTPIRFAGSSAATAPSSALLMVAPPGRESSRHPTSTSSPSSASTPIPPPSPTPPAVPSKPPPPDPTGLAPASSNNSPHFVRAPT